MKKSRVLAMMLAIVMVVSVMSTAVFAVEPPANSKVRVTDKTLTKTFKEEKVWDIWDTQGSFGTYTAGGVLTIKGGVVPFVMLDSFGGGLAGFDEMVIKYKTDSSLTVNLRERDANKTSAKVTLDATNGEYVEASISPSQFVGNSMTAADLENFRSYYDATAKKYTSTAMIYLDSSNASIESITCYWYSYSSESTQVRKTLSSKGMFPWGSWGTWTGGGTKSCPIKMVYVDGEAEDGVSKALVVTGGNTGSGSYAGGQFMMPGNFDLTGVDAVRYRYCSTANITAYFQRCYQIEVGEKLPANEVDALKGAMGTKYNYSDYFDANNKCIKYCKVETRSSGASLPSTGGEWKTIEFPISKFGTHEYLSHMKTFIANKSFAPNYMLRLEGCCYGEDTSKYFKLDSMEGVWFEKLPTMSSLSFDVNGSESEYLDLGKIDVNVELNNSADVAIEGTVIVVALYEKNKLIDVDVKTVNTPAMSKSGVQKLTVDLNADELLDEHQVRVMLWDSAASMNQITNLAVFDPFGYAVIE